MDLKWFKNPFLASFFELGLEELPGVGSTFDPNVHEALMKAPVDKPELHNVIINVYSTGYRINEIIIRTAQVIVGECPKSILDAAKEAEKVNEIEEVLEQVEENIEADAEQNSTDSDSQEKLGC